MIRFLTCTLFFLTICGAVIAQQPPASTPWDVTVKTNTFADSTLTVVNRCKQDHQFQVQTTNTPFLHFSATQVKVKGGATQLIPVKFDTRNLAPGVYQGTVLVICQSCKSEGTCMQDREVLQVTLRVTSDSPAAGPPGAPTTNQPANTPTTNQPPSNQPVTTQPASPVVTDQTPGKQAGASGVPVGVTTQIPPTNDPCAALKDETEKLRQIAEEKKAAAAAAQSEAARLKEAADQAEKDAKDAEAAAAKAARAAQPTSGGGKITADGETFDQADSDWLEAKKQKLLADRMAGKITPGEQERQREELSGTDALRKAREERLANEAKLKKEAEEAKAAAAKARAEADKAKAEADAAQKKADDARKEAAAARKKYDESEKKVKEECRKLEEAKAKAEAKAVAAAAAAEKKRKDEEELRLKGERERAQDAADQKYLLDNIKALKLIDSSAFKDVPGAVNAVIDTIIPDILGKTVEGVVEEMVTGAAEYTTANPIPISSIQALGGLYQIFAKRFDPCSPLGAPRIMDDLESGKYTRKYSHEEAQKKVFRMCKLLDELSDKLKKIEALQKQKSK